jgi:CheY-like chemotaxis protein
MSPPDLDDDDFLFTDEAELPVVEERAPARSPVKVLVVDDEPDVLRITKQSLRTTEWQGRPLELIEAQSGAEARRCAEEHPDIAVVLLDVVMETRTAGLDFARWLAGQARTPAPQIVLRTGQPGHHTFEQVASSVRLHSYLEKTTVSVERLRRAVLDAVDAYAKGHGPQAGGAA